MPGSDSEHSAVPGSAIERGMDTIGTITVGSTKCRGFWDVGTGLPTVVQDTRDAKIPQDDGACSRVVGFLFELSSCCSLILLDLLHVVVHLFYLSCICIY